ncbi:PE domain-containing protein [Nocardia colli]|uniref:PE domain-containing protein n=1 Tax=Nocardia colli TaxID=2545717 RepID=UPI0035E04909
MALEVVPSHFPIISAQLHAGQAQVAATAAPASAAAAPVPAAMDSISQWASQIITEYARSFFDGTSAGMDGHARLADVLPEVGASYETVDRSGAIIVGQRTT